ncbi:MAG: succinate dehydrogenase assembly factor 2 [Pseudomonadota bacterium]
MDRGYLIRRLKYLCHRRSSLELDLLLGALARRLDWERLTGQELSDLSLILELEDLTLQKSLLSRGQAPAGASPELWERLLQLIASL